MLNDIKEDIFFLLFLHFIFHMQLKRKRCEMKSESENEIIRRLSLIEKLLHQQDNRPLNLVEASEYLSISQSYLYKLTRQKLIPCHKPTGKYLYFFRRELEEWVSRNCPHPGNLSSGEQVKKGG